MFKHTIPAPEHARVVGLRREALILTVLMFVAAGFYFSWRLETFNTQAPALSMVVFAAELFALLSISLHVFMTMGVVRRVAPPPLENVTVDLFVTTYDEPVSMLRRTLVAAKAVRGATRVVLLDDGDRGEMRALAGELGVDYLARSVNTHAKAGNLNNALDHSTALFVATFDADHAPTPDFLERTLGYFRDEHVALVQTPQDFYNLDSFQHRRFGKSNRFWTEQSLFFRVIQPGKDRWNAAFYCGSCAVIRRFSLTRIGGFATGTVTEDLHTSIRLHKAGFETVYHNESLAFGVAPASYEPYQTQRTRWGKGAMHVWRKEGLVFARGLTIPQRLCYLASVITYFDAWQKFLFYVLAPFVLVTGLMPLIAPPGEFLLRFVPWLVLSLLVTEELGRGYARFWTIEQYNFLRMPAFLRATLAVFTPSQTRFRVTRKIGAAPSVSGQLALMSLVPLFAFAAIPYGIVRYLTDGHLTLAALGANIFWALFTGAVTTTAIAFAWRHNKERRRDYRFVAPLPFDVHLPSGGWGTLRAIDLTPDGVRLAAPMGLDFAVGRKVDAILRLPGGGVRVTLRVRHRAVVADDPLPKRMELGCALSFEHSVDQDRLNALLYGAGLEPRLLDLIERGPTPIEHVRREVMDAPQRDLRHAWGPGAVVANDNSFDVAVQPVNQAFDRWRILSYQVLPLDSAMRLPTSTGVDSDVRLRVVSTQAFSAGTSALHLTTVELIDAPARRHAEVKAAEPWLLVGASASALVFALIANVINTAPAESQVLELAGAEVGGDSSYVYVGAIAPLPGEDDGHGWAARFWGDRGTYSYETNGQTIDAETIGGEAAAVYRWAGDWGYASASAGVRYRDTDLSPNDPGNESDGGHTDVSLATNGRAHVNDKVDATWNVSQEVEQNNSFVRAGVDRDIGNGWRVGVDATRVSGDTYGENRAGLTAERRINDRSSISGRAGAARTDDGAGSGYIGLGIAYDWN